jgi:Asp/Glu/hydantoin racemase
VKIGIFSAAVMAASCKTQKRPVLTLFPDLAPAKSGQIDRQYFSLESEKTRKR